MEEREGRDGGRGGRDGGRGAVGLQGKIHLLGKLEDIKHKLLHLDAIGFAGFHPAGKSSSSSLKPESLSFHRTDLNT